MSNNILNILFSNRSFEPIDLQKVADQNNLQDSLNKYPWTYTPYAEDRKELFKNTYLGNWDEAIHLGRDIQVPSGEPIWAPINGFLANVWHDKDTDLGWGTRIDILDYNGRYWIFGHLSNVGNIYKDFKIGTKIKAGNLIGFVGNFQENGNVFEHLHLQVCNYNYVCWKGGPKLIDGYGNKNDLKYHHDPFTQSLLN